MASALDQFSIIIFFVEKKHKLKTWNFAHSFLYVNICNSRRSKSSRLHSGINNVILDSLEDAKETQEEGPLPGHLDS